MKTQALVSGEKPASRPTNGAAVHSPITVKKILAPTDFSPASEKGLKYALRLATEFGAQVTLLHVLEPAVPVTFEGMPMRWPEEGITSLEAAKTLKQLVTETRQGGFARVTGTTRRGFASYEIVSAAAELDADLIVIATHGYTGWKHFCIGSTAERVVRVAPCPVLVVREKEHDFC